MLFPGIIGGIEGQERHRAGAGTETGPDHYERQADRHFPDAADYRAGFVL